MITTLSQHINDSFSGIRKAHLKVLKQLNPDILAAKTATHLQTWATTNKLMTSVCCSLGRDVTQGICTKGEEEKVTRLRWFDTGFWLLHKAVDIGAIKIKLKEPTDNFKIKIRKGKIVSDKPRAAYHIKVNDDSIFDSLIYGVPLADFSESLHTLPQLERPLDWTTIHHPIAGDLIKNSNRRQRRYFRDGKKAEMLLRVVNKHQSIGYHINRDVLEVIKSSLEDDLMTRASKDLSESQRESLKALDESILNLATDIEDNIFYQYHYVDNRGRLYSSTSYLNNGGNKLAKSLFMMADKQKLGTEGLFWLKVQAANTFGLDDVLLDERVDFVDSILDEWLAWDLKVNKQWQEADDPYGFLAAVNELQKAYSLEDPKEYESGLLVALDASCSGLQVLSALSKDEKSGKLCNLTISDKKQDYYKMISKHWIDECAAIDDDLIKDYEDIEKRLSESSNRYQFLKDNFDELFRVAPAYWYQHIKKGRSITKRSAMVYLYSCKGDSMGAHVYSDFASELGGMNEVYSNWLGHRIYKACRKTMPGPTKMMKLFISNAKEMLKDGLQYEFVGPYNDFLMAQEYTKDKTQQVKVLYKGNRIRPRVIIEKGAELDDIKICNATAPNVVHCLDSQIVYKLLNEADYQISSIHDSFSAIAANAGKLFEDTRTTFVELFQGDPMKSIFDIDDFQYGDLDIDEVYDNEFCFS